MQEKLQILLVMQDDDFREILASDKKIEELEKEKFNPQIEYWQLMQILSGKSSLQGLIFKPITLALWSFLYSIQSPYVIGGETQEKDTDIFLYLLHNGFQGLTEDLFQESKDFCLKNQIDYAQGKLYLLQMINLSFRPFELIPKTGEITERSRFNLQWLCSIVSIVYKQVGCERFYILYRMSMIEVFYYVINHLKENDIKNQIKRRNSAEIDAEIFKRTYELGQIYYNTKYKNR